MTHSAKEARQIKERRRKCCTKFLKRGKQYRGSSTHKRDKNSLPTMILC